MSKGKEEPYVYVKRPLADLWKMLNEGKHHSLLKQCLTKEVYESLKDTKTDLGGDLGDCIQSGALNEHSDVGLYACDPQAYTTFRPLFDAVIQKYHKVAKVSHPPSQWGPDPKSTDKQIADLLGNLDPSNTMINSVRVRVGRSHVGQSFPPTREKEALTKTETLTKGALEALGSADKQFAGEYNSLEGMSKETEKKLVEDHFLFKDDDKCLATAGGYRDWPTGRGIFFNAGKTFLTWINEEDHLRFISMQQGGNLGECYVRLKKALDFLGGKMNFAFDNERGFLTFCPTNLGTAMRASVHIKIPNLAKNDKKLKEICEKYNLQPRGIHGEHTESVGGVYDISNKRRLGITEWEAVMDMKKGVEAIIEEEKKLG